ncbi:Uma2 family endonuclease [Leucothrix pacifica]|uniref:Uma2 family endonuclease n=1 Tax=Leucothrix pacifica TaxID=1247513 RepID=A0A317CHR6_9GAMM|nr:Uma2 family endonuclease [Leucothrix pacifica]PWQ95812.1 Uma2 family endonuclease [Leucothrix pacifica]
MYKLLAEDLPNYTYEDYYLWEGDWELVEGVPYAMVPAPVKIHQQLVGYLFKYVSEALEHCPDCDVLLDEDWKVSSQTILKPDLSVVCGDENPKFISKTPDVVFEVLSPSTARRDEGLKYRLYQEEGVRYYVLVYPDELVAKVYHLINGQYQKAAECDIDLFQFDGISCPFPLSFERVFQRFRK